MTKVHCCQEYCLYNKSGVCCLTEIYFVSEGSRMNCINEIIDYSK